MNLIYEGKETVKTCWKIKYMIIP